MSDCDRPIKDPAEREGEANEADWRAVEAGLAEIERGEIITLTELQRELEERRPDAS
jgi:predicted transcriptional regulator